MINAELEAAVQMEAVMLFIETATDAHQLNYLREHKIPKLDELNAAQRGILDYAAGQKLSTFNLQPIAEAA